jgi:hypothetical protein
MDRIQVESHSIRSIGYERQSRTLEIEFTHGGVYQYFGVPPGDYDELMGAESKGSGFHEIIRARGYPYSRVN